MCARRRSTGTARARSCARRSLRSARRRRRPPPRLRGQSPACLAPRSGARGARRRPRRPIARRAPALGMARMHLACHYAQHCLETCTAPRPVGRAARSCLEFGESVSWLGRLCCWWVMAWVRQMGSGQAGMPCAAPGACMLSSDACFLMTSLLVTAAGCQGAATAGGEAAAGGGAAGRGRLCGGVHAAA